MSLSANNDRFRSASLPTKRLLNSTNWSSSQSSLHGSSSSGSWSRAKFSANSKTNKNNVVHDDRFREIITHYERGLSECISTINNDLSLSDSSHGDSSHGDSSHGDSSHGDSGSAGSTSPKWWIQDTGVPRLWDPPRDVVNYKLAKAIRDSFRQQLIRAKHLHEEYDTHVRLREALCRIKKISKSRDCEIEWKENTRAIIGIEKQVETMLGNFYFTVEAFEGWARLCNRDLYEIEFRHGNQRHCVRVRIGRDGKRDWENAEFKLCATLLDSIVVRVREVKSGWGKRYVTLGVTNMETCDLMRSRPQVISLLANTSGSLKLRVCVSWTPTSNMTYVSMPNMVDDINSQNSREVSPVSRYSMCDRSFNLEEFQRQYRNSILTVNPAMNSLPRNFQNSSARDESYVSEINIDDCDYEEVEAAFAEFSFLDDHQISCDLNSTIKK